MTRAGEKMLTTVLASTCAALFVLAVALQFGVGRGYHWLEPGGQGAELATAGAIDRKSFELPPRTAFAAIEQRPLFNDDRRPSPEDTADTAPDAPPPSPLNISLTGTLMAARPELRMAMVRENGKVQTVALKEGMPLPGDQSGWTLSQVKKRSAIFKSTTGEEVEVELAMVNPGQNAGPQSRLNPGGPGGARNPRVPAVGPAGTPSDELQRRIEERRRQMREAAERMKAERQAEQQKHPAEQ
jgi:general secretion pathway protein N